MTKLEYFLPLVLAVHSAAFAQPIPPASIADKEMGWIKVYNFPPATEPLKVDTRVYSTAQRNIAVDLANWMQASYNPIGGLGEVVRTFPKVGPAVPQSYGVIGHIYNVLKYGANRKIELYTTDGFSWNVMVNGSFRRGVPGAQHAGALLLHDSQLRRAGIRRRSRESRRPRRPSVPQDGSPGGSSATRSTATASSSCCRRTRACRS